MDAARQHSLDMRHQPNVIGVVVSDVREIVGGRLPAREMLPEVGETAGERMAACIDDLRIGQDQLDERYVEPVVRQLVDEEWAIRSPLHARALEILKAQF